MSASGSTGSGGNEAPANFAAMIATVEISLSEMSRMLDILETELAEMTVETTIAKARALQVLFDAPPPEPHPQLARAHTDGTKS